MSTPEELTREAVDRVDEHADPSWMAAAWEGGSTLSRLHAEWSTDDLWAWLEENHPDITTHEPRAMGAVIQSLKRNRVIAAEPARYIRSKLGRNHMRPIPVNVSQVYQGSTS